MFQCQSNYPKLFEILFRLHKKKYKLHFLMTYRLLLYRSKYKLRFKKSQPHPSTMVPLERAQSNTEKFLRRDFAQMIWTKPHVQETQPVAGGGGEDGDDGGGRGTRLPDRDRGSSMG